MIRLNTKDTKRGDPVGVQREMNPTSIHEVMRSIPGLAW